MKNIFFNSKQILVLAAFILSCGYSFGQVHWLVNTDSIPNCELLKSGKFVNMESSEIAKKGYSIVFTEKYATEYINDGEYYLKSKIVFTSDCEYQSTVIESTAPENFLGVGTVIHTEIIETNTEENLIELKTIFEGKDYFFILKKIE